MANLVDQVKELLDTIQQNMFDVAKQKRDECIKVVRTWDEFIEALGQKKLILAPWCDEEVYRLWHDFYFLRFYYNRCYFLMTEMFYLVHAHLYVLFYKFFI